MKLYFKCVILLLFTALNLGILLPYLFSSRMDELVVLGVADIILSPIVLFYLIKSIFTQEKK